MVWNLVILSIFFTICGVGAYTTPRTFCQPSQSCWPSTSDVSAFTATITGLVMLPSHPDYNNYTTNYMMSNLRFSLDQPPIIVFANDQDDVVRCVEFVKKFNIQAVVLSSGHSYVGRSTSSTALQINLSRLTNVTVDTSNVNSPTGASVEMFSGAPWEKTYRAVDAAGYVVVGGSAHTVSVGGYTQGGGHSPMSRALGLGVDQVLEMTVVTMDGLVRRVNQTGQMLWNTTSGSSWTNSDDDLFWALRGGGGNTFGIVISFKYMIHLPPSGFVYLTATWPYISPFHPTRKVGESVSSQLDNWMKSMSSPGWGGYIIYSQYNDPILAAFGMTGALSLFLLHYGDWDANVAADVNFIDGLESAHRFNTYNVTNVTTFWEYEKNVNDPRGYYTYIFTSFQQVQHLDGRLASFAQRRMQERRLFGCTVILLGGNMTQYSDNSSAVGSTFRNARTNVACGIPMANYAYDYQVNSAQDMARDVSALGSGMYFNEADSERSDWKTAFWGDKYARLLEIKKKYDPDQWLVCYHCVGYVASSPALTSSCLLLLLLFLFKLLL